MKIYEVRAGNGSYDQADFILCLERDMAAFIDGILNTYYEGRDYTAAGIDAALKEAAPQVWRYITGRIAQGMEWQGVRVLGIYPASMRMPALLKKV